MTNKTNTRELVLDILLEITKEGTPSHIALRNTLTKYQYLDKSQRSFINRIVQGTIENQILLDYIINQFSKVKTNKMKPLIRNLIRMSTYQILYLDKTPDSAICNEAVGLAKKRGFSTLSGFVNGVLRNISRGRASITYPNKEEDLAAYLSIMNSMPLWIVELVIEQYGLKASEIITNMNQHEEGTTLRIDPRIKEVDKLIHNLENQGISVESSALYPLGINIKNYDYLESIEEFLKGQIYPQDVSSMLVAHIAAPKPNDYCIDMCSAPGGKAIHLAQLLDKTGHVDARDVSDMKLSYIEENIARCNVSNISTSVSDATLFNEKDVESADLVLCDVPCSGLGVTRKKGDIKYNMTKEGLSDLIDLQKQILTNGIKYLKVGGTLIFSTCTINKNENTLNLKWLVENFPLKAEDITKYLPANFHEDEAKNGYIQLLPGEDGTDGFFIARLIKQEHYE